MIHTTNETKANEYTSDDDKHSSTPSAEEANCPVCEGTFPCDVHKKAGSDTEVGKPLYGKEAYYMYEGSTGNPRNVETLVPT